MIRSVATIRDLNGLLALRGELTLDRRRYGALILQVAVGEAYAIRKSATDEYPVAIAGIAPVEGGSGEIWFGVRHGGLGSLLLPVVREARAVIRSRRKHYPQGLLCLVAPGYRPGERLATSIGFAPTGIVLGGLQEWVWNDEHANGGRTTAPVCSAAAADPGADGAAGRSARSGACAAEGSG